MRIVKYAIILMLICSMSAAIAEEKTFKTIDSGWKSLSELNAMFKQHVDNRFMPHQVTGKIDKNGVISYRALFKPFPQDLDYFYAFWGINEKAYQTRKRELEIIGFKETWRQSFADASSEKIYQVVWLRTLDQDAVAARSKGDFGREAYVKLSTGKYVELEQQYKGVLESYDTGKISDEEFSTAFEVLENADGLESRFDEWVKTYPRSYTARLARGSNRVSAAWKRRNTKFSRDTTDEQFKAFHEGLTKASSDLNDSLKLYSRPIPSYRLLIRIATGLQQGDEVSRGLLDQALKIDPKALTPRVAYQNSITPKWGGSVRRMEQFLQECKNSKMNPRDKERIESKHYTALGEKAFWTKDYREASDYFLKAYQHTDDPDLLLRSGKSAYDGNFFEVALQRYDTLIKKHPKYSDGFTHRGALYEDHLNSDEKAFNDYLAAADLGDNWAQNRVGWWYMTGRYVALDYSRAEIYLRRAAAQNNQTAISNLFNLEKMRHQSDKSGK